MKINRRNKSRVDNIENEKVLDDRIYFLFLIGDVGDPCGDHSSNGACVSGVREREFKRIYSTALVDVVLVGGSIVCSLCDHWIYGRNLTNE